MAIISLEVEELLSYVRSNSPVLNYLDVYKYIYRRTGFTDFELSMFQSQVDSWIDKLINNETERSEWFDLLDREGIYENIKKENPALSSLLDIITIILNKGKDYNIDYTPQLSFLSLDDRDRVSTILDFVDPLINGISIVDGGDYIGSVLNDEKMIQGASIVRDLYEKYKDFQFDVMALASSYGSRLDVFNSLFDLYKRRAKYILYPVSDSEDHFPKEETLIKYLAVSDKEKWLSMAHTIGNYQELADFLGRKTAFGEIRNIPSKKGGGLFNLACAEFPEIFKYENENRRRTMRNAVNNAVRKYKDYSEVYPHK